MELLLNLCWLFLILPAFWVWREAQVDQNSQSRQALLILGCLLILLFPIVSASDDLQAMRPEIEESSTRNGFRNSGHVKVLPISPGGTDRCLPLAARPSGASDPILRRNVHSAPIAKPVTVALQALVGRAPPSSFLG